MNQLIIGLNMKVLIFLLIFNYLTKINASIQAHLFYLQIES